LVSPSLLSVQEQSKLESLSKCFFIVSLSMSLALESILTCNIVWQKFRMTLTEACT
jgi:hypothetical protein